MQDVTRNVNGKCKTQTSLRGAMCVCLTMCVCVYQKSVNRSLKMLFTIDLDLHQQCKAKNWKQNRNTKYKIEVQQYKIQMQNGFDGCAPRSQEQNTMKIQRKIRIQSGNTKLPQAIQSLKQKEQNGCIFLCRLQYKIWNTIKYTFKHLKHKVQNGTQSTKW